MRLPGAAVRVVVAPDGTEWKIYVGRFRSPRWQPSDYEGSPGAVGGSVSLVFAAVDVVLSVIYDLLVPLLRLVVKAPFTLMRSSRSPRRTIEALSIWPHEERYVWATEATEVDRVVDEIAAGLRRGKFLQPAGTEFLGPQ